MLARIRKAMEKKDHGFTLIELLVVMVIIGILAAIAIPTFLGQKSKARVTALKSDATYIQQAFASYYVDGTTAPTLSAASGTATVGTQTVNLSGGDLVIASPAATATATGTYCVVLGTGTSSDGYVTVTSAGVSAVVTTLPSTCAAA